MFTLKKSECVPLTRELAEQVRDMTPSKTERQLEPKRLKYLIDRIEAGLFVCPHWVVVEINGERQRINGQHSSRALCEVDGAFPEGLFAHIDTFQASEPDDEVMLFRTQDARMSGRTGTDVAGAYINAQPDLEKKVSAKLGKIALSGANFWKRIEGEGETYSGDDIGRLASASDVRAFLLWFVKLPIIGKSRELYDQGIVAAMMGTFQMNRGAATTFWTDTMQRRNQFDDTHPTTVLENYCVMLKDRDERPRKMPNTGDRHEAARIAWNAARAEKPLTLKALTKARSNKGFTPLSE